MSTPDKIPDQVIGTASVVHDNAEPTSFTPRTVDDAIALQRDDDGPAAPTRFVGEDKRSEVYARLRDRAHGRNAPAPELPVEPTDAIDPMHTFVPPFAQPGAQQDEAPAAPAAPAAPVGKTYKLKVNHNVFDATREQVVEMAGLDPAEADGLPDAVIVRSAQIMEARRQALADAKKFQAPDDRREPSAHQAENGSDHEAEQDRSNPASASAPSSRELELIQKVQFGTEEEAAAAQGELTEIHMDRRDTKHRARAISQTIDSALSTFATSNADIINDARAMSLVTVDVMDVVKNELKRNGRDPRMVDKLQFADIGKEYAQAILQGLPVLPVTQVLGEAEARTRSTLNLPKHSSPSPATAPAPANALQQRIEAKRGLAQTPQRAGAPVQSAPPRPVSRNGSRMDTINQMRQSRFQKPIAS